MSGVKKIKQKHMQIICNTNEYQTGAVLFVRGRFSSKLLPFNINGNFFSNTASCKGVFFSRVRFQKKIHLCVNDPLLSCSSSQICLHLSASILQLSSLLPRRCTSISAAVTLALYQSLTLFFYPALSRRRGVFIIAVPAGLSPVHGNR